MKRVVEKTLGIGIGLLIISVMIMIAAVIFGSSAVGILSLIIGFPVAFPMTTGVLVVVFLLIFLRRNKKKPD